ncbi:MAG: transketolase, partial [Corynebacterium casei]|nr:transketolase [Corynebacterium casei]
KTFIGYPAPHTSNPGGVHGSALGDDDVAATKEILGFDPAVNFHIDDEVIAHTRKLADRGAEKKAAWQEKFDKWAAANPENKALFDRLAARELPEGFTDDLPSWDADPKGVATRKASEAAIQALAAKLPEMWGGSADLAGSNNTVIKGAPSFGPETITTDMWSADPHAGRNLHFGIREHAMAAIMNGIALHGNTRIYGGTFLIFSEYQFPAVRLGSLMSTDTYYVWTHDSIGLGEDGPTHQPVEVLSALRAVPNLSVIRPADANETVQAWAAAMEYKAAPKGLSLTRQNIPVLEGTKEKAAEGVRRGGYVLVEASKQTPDVILLATGSEVQLAVEAAKELEAAGTATRVVSMPCQEWFDEQPVEYREQVLPNDVLARVSVEAGIAQSWHKYLGFAGRAVSIELYGASAPAEELFERFGFTAAKVVEAAQESLAAAKK